jgi:sec-independent protein translocase protein TatA
MEGLLILVVIILLFGAKRLPELARSMGKSLTEFKRGKEELAKELEAGRKEAANPSTQANQSAAPDPAKPS